MSKTPSPPTCWPSKPPRRRSRGAFLTSLAANATLSTRPSAFSPNSLTSKSLPSTDRRAPAISRTRSPISPPPARLLATSRRWALRRGCGAPWPGIANNTPQPPSNEVPRGRNEQVSSIRLRRRFSAACQTIGLRTHVREGLRSGYPAHARRHQAHRDVSKTAQSGNCRSGILGVVPSLVIPRARCATWKSGSKNRSPHLSWEGECVGLNISF